MADIFKNTAAKFIVFAFDSTTNLPKTGDAANITAYVSKDYGAATVLADTTATEIDATNAKGYYLFDAAQAETNADCLLITAKSATANIVVIGAPAVIFTRPQTGYLAPTTLGRTLVVDASGLADANAVKMGPTGSGTALTARDIGLSVLLSTGTGTGQLDFTSGVVKANATQWLGGTIPAVNVTGVPLVDLKYTLGTISPAAAGSVRADAVTGAVGSVTGAVGSVTARVTANTDQLAGQTVTAAAGVTFPASLASPTNITAGTITTVTNLTNAPTAGDFTATMKTSLNAATPASVVGAVGSVTAGVTVSTNNDKTGYTIATGGIASGAHTATEINNMADGFLDRRMDLGTDSGGDTTTSRTVRQAFFALRNKVTIAAGVGTITKCDDTTTSWTSAIATTAGNPISSIDPT